jgi:hypothetical protein
MCAVEERTTKGAFGQDRGVVFERDGNREANFGRIAHLQPTEHAFVGPKERSHAIALCFENGEKAFVTLRVSSFLGGKAAHFREQRRIFDTVDEGAHAAHEKAFSDREEQMERVDELRADGRSAEPVARNLFVKRKPRRARLRRCSRGHGALH